MDSGFLVFASFFHSSAVWSAQPAPYKHDRGLLGAQCRARLAWLPPQRSPQP